MIGGVEPLRGGAAAGRVATGGAISGQEWSARSVGVFFT